MWIVIRFWGLASAGVRALAIGAFIASAFSCVATTTGTKIVSYPALQVVPNSWILARKLKVVDVQTGSTNGLLRIQVEALNATRRDLVFEYRYRWLDGDGFEVKTPTSTWVTIFSDALDKVRMEGIAPNKDVKNWEFVVRLPVRG